SAPTPNSRDPVSMGNGTRKTHLHCVRDESENVDHVAFSRSVGTDQSRKRAELKGDVLAQATVVGDAQPLDHDDLLSRLEVCTTTLVRYFSSTNATILANAASQ